MMKVTRTRINLRDGSRGEVAEAMVVLEDSLVVHSIKIRKVGDNLFVCMPVNHERRGKKIVNGKKVPWDVVHPTNREFSDYLSDVILTAYKEELEKQ